MSPFSLIFIAVLGILLLLFLVIRVRLQAFVALLIASFFVAILAGIPLTEVTKTIQEGMGTTLGFIAIVVALGSMFGEMLRVTGGAEQLARTLVGRFGEDRVQWALGLTGFLVAIPVFFDVGLIILLPLVYSLAQRTGKSLLYYAFPLAAGLAVAHSFIPPTPGPVAVASLLGADLGWVILFGTIAGLPAMVAGGIIFGQHIAKKIHAKVPEYMLVNEPQAAAVPAYAATSASALGSEELAAYEHNPVGAPGQPFRKDLPSFGLVVSLIVIPLALILANTVSGVVLPEGNFIRNLLGFLGHPFTALLIAALCSFYFLGTRRGYSNDQVQEIATKSLEPVGLIILVTGAGGVLGKVLVASGVGNALATLLSGSNVPIILLAFLMSTAVRISQGSATVAMVTTAGIVAPILQTGSYSAPALGLITIAIASGATVVSHVNDSGFWLVSRYLGLSEKDTLRSWTIMETIIGLVGFAVVFAISFFV
ncbi:GntP family permease [Leptolyngbya sp. FACHB-261]|uniref:GntP family permease n=1 Tax=Leptolyngbya sp. FACHB-261 TaxID=2692806 RepID=UPI0016829E35|nr:SLC13 family permease [Leptolyngbya sp. FACHB-261]MBD2102908.1 gluconate transporter [Leptolyngbya sp. FACHB-261]